MTRIHNRNPRFPASRVLQAVLLAALLLTAPVVTATPMSAQTQPILTWQGEIRPRIYGREPVEGQWDHWISMRSRVGLDARIEPGLGLFFQIQDVRFWGEEVSNRDRDSDAIDFHQAYLEVASVPGIGGLVRGGRQEVTVAEGRFIAAPDWGQGGQSFDGIRWTRPLGEGHLDVVYLRIREGSSPVHQQSADFTAAWLAIPGVPLGSLELLGIHDRSSDPAGTGQTTVGSIWKGDTGVFSFAARGMYQLGEREGIDVAAFMVAFRGSMALLDRKGTITVWYDHLSGDSDARDGKTGAFSTLFGARHRFYGRADYFLNIPDDTGQLGLRDAALKLAYAPNPEWFLNLDLHSFSTAEPGHLSSRGLAEEVDLWIGHQFRGALALEVGYSLTFAGTAMEELGRLRGMGNVGYFMTSLRF